MSAAKDGTPAAGLRERAWVTRSEGETFRLAEELASSFEGTEVVLMTGELGAGKTVFAKGLAAGAGVADPQRVCSPSFTLVNIYDGRFRVYHVDLYRLERAADVDDLGWEDILGQGIVIIEWAEKLPFSLDGIRVRIEVGRGDERTIRVAYPAL